MTVCRVCQGENTSVFFEIEDVPIHCNLLWPNRHSALTAPRGDIQLDFCKACGMVYNVAFDAGHMQYASGYETSLHFSPHFQHYAEELATRLVKQYDLQEKNVIEIGCGQGEFLSLLCEEGRNRGTGFDPSFDPGKQAVRGNHITFVRDFYSRAHSSYKADFICCRHVLEHVDDPRAFLGEIRRAIGSQETVVFFEVPNVLFTLRDLGIWDIIYEHCSYFSPASLTRVFEETGFRVLRVEEAYGGQFLCLEAVPSISGDTRPSLPFATKSQMERLVDAFSEQHKHKVKGWRRRIGALIDKQKRTVVWGAGSKGVTFLNMLKMDNNVDYVVDLNPRKQGLFVPGTGQYVVPPDTLGSSPPDAVIVMNPLYAEEIRRTITNMNVCAELLAA